MSDIREDSETKISYYAVLEKFDGDGTEPENLVERLHVEDDVVVKVEKFENGELVSSEDVTQDFNDALRITKKGVETYGNY